MSFLVFNCDAQGTAFTYQGRLTDGTNLFTGNAEFQPTLWNDPSVGSQVAANSPATVIVSVANGLFVLPLDFGGAPLNAGADRWLQLQVRTTIGPFSTLTPRQKLSPTPYAIYSANAAVATIANSVSSVAASNITGTLGLAQLPATVLTNSQNGVNLNGTFTGNGGALSNLSANALVTILTNLSVTTWGLNQYGLRAVPSDLNNAVALASGIAHSLALRSDGTVTAWGAGQTNSGIGSDFGQSIVPAGLNSVAAVAAGYITSFALKSNGTVTVWGSNDGGQTNVPPGLNNVSAISAGFTHVLALKRDGTVVAWGTNDYGQASVPPGLSSVAAISAGFLHSLALRSNGTVVAWGDNGYTQTNLPPGLNNVAAIAAGGIHSLALKSNGTVVAWGAGLINAPTNGSDFGQSIVPAGLSNVIAISAGVYHSVALTADGTVIAWGDNEVGETNVPPGLNNVVALGVGSTSRHVLALRRRSHAPVAWLDSDNTFNGNIEVNGNLRVFGDMSAGGDLRLNDRNIWLRVGEDTENGLGWYGLNKVFNDFAQPAPNGPVLFGSGGGGLGTVNTNGETIALCWNSLQQVGIGTTTPQARLSLGNDYANSKLLLTDGSLMGMGAQPNQFRLHLNSAADRFSFLSAPTGADLVTVQGNGSVGIGTNAPASKLQVRGDIRLGSIGQYLAPGGEENLRIIRGVISSTGTILAGSGFSASRTGTGAYTVTFSNSFTALPAVTATVQSGLSRLVTCTNVGNSSAQFRTYVSSTEALADLQFHFIAVGSR
jgi:hypothetical protein